MEYTIAYIFVGLAVLLICCAGIYFSITDGTNTHSDNKYIVKKITDNIKNKITYRVCRREYHAHIGYIEKTLKVFEKEELAKELAKKLMTDGEMKEEILYVENKQINNN